MLSSTNQVKNPLIRLVSSSAIILLAAVLLLNGNRVAAQKLQLSYTFDGTGTTAASDPSGGALSVPLTLLSFSGAATDLHGAANTGVQNQGQSLNLSSATNGTGSGLNGPIAQAINNAALGTLGVVSNFTMAIWFKEDSIITNEVSRGGRLATMGTNGVTDQTGATTNCIYLFFQTTNAIYARVNNSIISAPFYYNPLPTNVWMFLAVTYDGTNNARLYFGTEASPAKLIAIRSIGSQSVDFGSGGGSGNFILGNRSTDRARAFDGWIDEFRFYTGAGDANFVENLRQSSTPVLITGLYPDGTSLMQGTNRLSFVASSTNSIDPGGIKVAVNGTDVSSNLVISGSSTNRTVSYTGLPVNPALVRSAPLNAVTINIRVTDNGGIITSNLITYDAFSSTNYTWECEDYDYADDPFSGPGALFIDNPRYAFESAPDTYWQRQGQPPVDYFDNASTPQNDVFRGPLDLGATEFSVSTGVNGGPSVGELMRQKILDALAINDRIRDVDVGNFDNNNWMNYTRTFPTGTFNVYTRAAYGGAAVGGSTLEEVTSGVGTPVQTTNTLGGFTLPNTGGWQGYQWVPLRDAAGNLVRVNLGGLKTLRLTARANGGGNNNFLMVTPANTNIPVIANIYPNGTNMFQPSAAFSFTASSPIGASIATNSINVALTIRTILTTNTTILTATNGLVITGAASNRTVSLSLVTNATYTAAINLTDANGGPAATTVQFDTYNPVFVWESEDYDYGGGQSIDNPAPDAYADQVGTPEIDYHDNVGTSQNVTPVYRTGDPAGLEINGDTPPRLQFIGTGFTDYDVGWYDIGNWNNYTRTIPAGDYNIYLRGANGSGGAGLLTLARVTSGQGTATQTTTNLGTFTIPANAGAWQAYTWIPLRDANGNLAKLSGGGVQTLRATSSGGVNANFYGFFPANTNLPIISGVYPNGTALFQSTNKLSFAVTSSAGVATNSVTVVLDGTVITNLVFSGSATARSVSYLGLKLNSPHTAVISVTDVNGNSAQTTVNFDTFSSALYTWEAEDYDHDGGKFTDNPQVDAYTNLTAILDVDFHETSTGGTYTYRPTGTATAADGDLPRSQFVGAFDFYIGFFGANEWGNYTRDYPAGNYNAWGRIAAGGGDTAVDLSLVTAGWGTTDQTAAYLGTFNVLNSGWTSFGWVPLRDTNGNLVSVTMNGSTNTLRVGRQATGPDANVNFFMLVPAAGPVTLAAHFTGGSISLSFATQIGTSYQIEFKNDLADAVWTPLGAIVSGDGTTKTVTDPASGPKRFYRLRTQ